MKDDKETVRDRENDDGEKRRESRRGDGGMTLCKIDEERCGGRGVEGNVRTARFNRIKLSFIPRDFLNSVDNF
jgi:hypothetical protein